MVAPITGKVVAHRQWTDTLFSIQIEADINPFEPGQFGRIGLMIDDKPIMRPYSFVNAADETPLEFYYILVEGGPLTQRLPHLPVGSDILINEKSNGFLVLSEVPDAQQLWMLSTGTALGPFLSILKSAPVWQRFEELVLVHAVRQTKELTYQDQINQLVAVGAGKLRYIPFVSREETDFAMCGRIPPALQDGSLAARAGLTTPTPENAQFMLCGNPEMVKDTSEVLYQLDFLKNRRRTPGQVTVENYW